MKRKLFCLIAALVLCGTMCAQEGHHYQFDHGQFYNNMPIVAQIQINGVVQNSTQIELGTSVAGDSINGICGSEFLTDTLGNAPLVWLQSYYTRENATVSFMIYNHSTNTEYTTCYTTKATRPNGYGTKANPLVLNFLVPYVFTGEGNWSTASNWQGGVVPADGNAVEIDGNCTMDVDAVMASVTVNTGNTLTIPAGKTLTATYALNTTAATQLVIQEGGQLYGNVANAYATVEKGIQGYGSNSNSKDNYYFIASPLVNNTPRANVTNLISNAYDWYRFDQAQDDEWRNMKNAPNYTIKTGEGYLYANSSDVILGFAGQLNSSISSRTVTCSEEEPYFMGWNLVGNPFTHNINVSDLHFGDAAVTTIYSISGSQIVASQNSIIAPAEGFFVYYTASPSGTLYFEPQSVGAALPVSDLRMEVRSTLRDASLLDRAYVNFDQGADMPKFAFGDGNVQLYIPQDGKELAVVRSEAQGEIPVNFKTRQNGSYTLNICLENMALDYLHLIDNITGADIDLLVEPSYTFTAKKSDYASRFRLVFDANENSAATGSETFAYFNGSEWQISNMGEATLQVIDVTGRVVKNETISGNASISINEAPGVYMMRLVSGNDVKVQKVVVR